MTTETNPAGYTYDSADLPPSPVGRQRFDELLTDVMWTADDAAALRRAGEILTPRVSDILDVWYDFIGSTPHLVTIFRGPDGEPDGQYLERVRGRFERWVSMSAPANLMTSGWPTKKRSVYATIRPKRTRPTESTRRHAMFQ